jgi:7,8-dihydro-6-hydroxymethylpterin-pyrophosphokinase
VCELQLWCSRQFANLVIATTSSSIKIKHALRVLSEKEDIAGYAGEKKVAPRRLDGGQW